MTGDEAMAIMGEFPIQDSSNTWWEYDDGSKAVALRFSGGATPSTQVLREIGKPSRSPRP